MPPPAPPPAVPVEEPAASPPPPPKVPIVPVAAAVRPILAPQLEPDDEPPEPPTKPKLPEGLPVPAAAAPPPPEPADDPVALEPASTLVIDGPPPRPARPVAEWEVAPTNVDFEVVPPPDDAPPADAVAATEAVAPAEVADAGDPDSGSDTGEPSSSFLFPGSEVGFGHKLVRLLGRGNHGEVWEAKVPGGKSCAIKIVRNLKARESQQELKALEIVKDLTHEHILPIQAYWLLDDKGHVVDDDADGADRPKPRLLVVVTPKAEKNLMRRLRDYQKHGYPGIPMAELLRYMRQAAQAIDYMKSAPRSSTATSAPKTSC
jgi:hypothetical protein